MSFDWMEYLNLARELARPTTNPARREARLRSAISRAYCAVFIQARNHLRDKDGIAIPQIDKHHFVIRQFRNSTDGNRRTIAWLLNQLRRDRNQADYEDTVIGLPGTTRRVLTHARQVITLLDRL